MIRLYLPLVYRREFSFLLGEVTFSVQAKTITSENKPTTLVVAKTLKSPKSFDRGRNDINRQHRSTNIVSGYVYKRSDLFRSVWDRILFGTDPLCSHWTGSKLERYGSILYGITFISGPIWYQIADPIRTGSTRSSGNTRLIPTHIFVPVPKGSGPV